MHPLRKYLAINSIFSGFSGLVMIIFSNGLNDFFNIQNQYVFPVIGINLLIFSIFIWYVSRNYMSNRILINLICGLDALWVLGSMIIILTGLFDLSVKGYILTGIVAVWVAYIGYKQFSNYS